MASTTAQVKPPTEREAATSFERLRSVVEQHVQHVMQHKEGHRSVHVELASRISAAASAARVGYKTAAGIRPGTLAGAELQQRTLTRQLDVERAYSELLAALVLECGRICA